MTSKLTSLAFDRFENSGVEFKALAAVAVGGITAFTIRDFTDASTVNFLVGMALGGTAVVSAASATNWAVKTTMKNVREFFDLPEDAFMTKSGKAWHAEISKIEYAARVKSGDGAGSEDVFVVKQEGQDPVVIDNPEIYRQIVKGMRDSDKFSVLKKDQIANYQDGKLQETIKLHVDRNVGYMRGNPGIKCSEILVRNQVTGVEKSYSPEEFHAERNAKADVAASVPA
ncbi:hypothetical protein [Thalassospira xiamenensis]|uniref:Uncharacterized protein n=1 Tax=Thalassospira xiamenensis TaxID=220697 RepID=A0A285TXH2_9PROT|nr:hypothetical protein [Thalassospira xiamenensis]SOC26985.1 hypothetical protein SAMN05428964_105246 [Thalassospira xiamenensis]